MRYIKIVFPNLYAKFTIYLHQYKMEQQRQLAGYNQFDSRSSHGRPVASSNLVSSYRTRVLYSIRPRSYNGKAMESWNTRPELATGVPAARAGTR